MTEIINKDILIQEKIEFATFWSRAGAYIADGIMIGAFSIIINAINISNFKSFLMYLSAATIAILYKPFMEHKYEATFGKMIFKLKVSDRNLNQIDFKRSFLRSFILMLPTILFVPIYYLALNNPNLTKSTELIDFAQALSIEYPMVGWINNLIFIILIIEIVVLLTDQTKTRRSLHDRIAKTFVTYTESNKKITTNR